MRWLRRMSTRLFVFRGVFLLAKLLREVNEVFINGRLIRVIRAIGQELLIDFVGFGVPSQRNQVFRERQHDADALLRSGVELQDLLQRVNRRGGLAELGI